MSDRAPWAIPMEEPLDSNAWTIWAKDCIFTQQETITDLTAKLKKAEQGLREFEKAMSGAIAWMDYISVTGSLCSHRQPDQGRGRTREPRHARIDQGGPPIQGRGILSDRILVAGGET